MDNLNVFNSENLSAEAMPLYSTTTMVEQEAEPRWKRFLRPPYLQEPPKPLPFFYPSVAVKKQIDVTDDLLQKFDQIRQSARFKNFVTILGEKYPEISKQKMAQDGSRKVHCETCERFFITWKGLVKHTLSATHILNMKNMGYVFHAKDLDDIWSVFEEAYAFVPSDNTTTTTVNGSPIEFSDIVANTTEWNQFGKVTPFPKTTPEDNGHVESKNSSLASPGKKSRSDLPFFHGTTNVSLKISGDEVASILAGPRKVASLLEPDVVTEILLSDYKIPKPSRCPVCKRNVATSKWIEHLISQKHLDKLDRRERYVSRWDLCCLMRLLNECETAQLVKEGQIGTTGENE